MSGEEAETRRLEGRLLHLRRRRRAEVGHQHRRLLGLLILGERGQRVAELARTLGGRKVPLRYLLGTGVALRYLSPVPRWLPRVYPLPLSVG